MDAKVNAKWKHVSWFFLDISLEQIFSKLKPKFLNRNNNIAFYADLLNTWYDFISKAPGNIEEVLNEKIFNNSSILIDNKPITHFEKLENFGITTISDLYSY